MPAPCPTTRRDFLRGRPLVQAVEELRNRAAAGDALATCRVPAAAPDGSLVTVARRAMACQFEIVLPATTPAAVQAASAALDEIDRLEDQMTVYRDSSEVSRINSLAAATPVPVEERLFGLFETALRLAADTDGAFDMAAGALIKCWGFFRGPKRVPGPDELAGVLQRIGSRHVVLDRERRTIEFRRPGLELNLGAIGKGYALDRAAELLRRDWGVTSAILHGGRSSVYAIGNPNDAKGVRNLFCRDRQRARIRPCDSTVGETGQKVPDTFLDGWLVGVVHPLRDGERVATVRLRDAALGTSGATIQYFEANGRRFGHILDPRTGWPADEQACVSVIAPTAAEADALSTALFILGPDKAREYCDRHPEIGAIVVSAPTGDGPLEVAVLGRATSLVKLQSPPLQTDSGHRRIDEARLVPDH